MRKAAVSVRGLGSNFLSNRMLLLIDGRPATDPWTGQFYADETTPMTNLKQIEVIRGPGSSLYGSNAFSGVINLITRGPDDLMQSGRPYGFEARVLAGQYDTFRVQATAAGRAGPVKALINYYGFLSSGAELLDQPALNIVDKNEWTQVHQVSGKVQIKSFTLDAGYTYSNEGRPGGQTVTQVGNCGRCHYTPNDKERVDSFWLNAQVDQKLGSMFRIYGDFYANFKRRDVTLENLVTTGPEDAIGKRRRLGGEARALFTSHYVNVTVGGDVKADDVNSQNVLPGLQLARASTSGNAMMTTTNAPLTEEIVGVFADTEVRPLSQLILGAGVRYDYYHLPAQLWANASSQVSPRADVIYHIVQQLSLRANYGRAFRAPSLAELAIDQQMYAATLLGNPYLRAETVDTVEAAVDAWPFRDYLRLSLTGFYNYAGNLINQQQIGSGSTSQFQNIGTAKVAGLEVEAAAQVRQLDAGFDVAYQYLNSNASTTADNRPGPLDYAPNHRVYLRAHKRFGFGLFIDFYGLYVGERLDPAIGFDANGNRTSRTVLPGYFVANARVGARVWRTLTASVIATNLFNAHYEEMLGYPAPGISVFCELKASY
jgi:outer membrane receptor protein involved in Fe transport